MAIRLTPEQIENIKKYRYASSDWTPLDLCFNPWWEFVTNRLSKVRKFIASFYLIFAF